MIRVLLVIDDYNEMIYLQTVLKKIGFDVEGLNSAKKYADASLGFNPKVVIGSTFGKKVDLLGFGKDIRKKHGIPKLIALKPAGKDLSKELHDSAGIDMVVETPVNIQKLVLGMCTLMGIEESGFLDKLSKINSRDGDDGIGPTSDMMLGSLDNFDGDIREKMAGKEVGQLLGLDDRPKAAPADNSGIVQIDDSEVDGEEVLDFSKPSEAARQSKEDVITRRGRFEKFMATMEKPKTGRFPRERIFEFNKKIRSAPKPDDLDEVEDERQRFVKSLFNKNR